METLLPLATPPGRQSAQRVPGGQSQIRRPQRSPFALRPILRCDLCGLRMQGSRRRSGNYCMCEALRWPELVPQGHPQTVSLPGGRAMDKVLEFLQTRVFRPERAALLAQALATRPLTPRARSCNGCGVTPTS
jgi:hypothetical protein